MNFLYWFFLGLMALLYVAAGVNHFVNPGFYLSIMPDYLPAHLTLVYLSGVAEILLGALLLPRQTRRWAAWGIVAMLAVFLIVHIDMIVQHEQRYMDIPVVALWLRLVLQIPLIAWAWFYTRRRASDREPTSISGFW